MHTQIVWRAMDSFRLRWYGGIVAGQHTKIPWFLWNLTFCNGIKHSFGTWSRLYEAADGRNARTHEHFLCVSYCSICSSSLCASARFSYSSHKESGADGKKMRLKQSFHRIWKSKYVLYRFAVCFIHLASIFSSSSSRFFFFCCCCHCLSRNVFLFIQFIIIYLYDLYDDIAVGFRNVSNVHFSISVSFFIRSLARFIYSRFRCLRTFFDIAIGMLNICGGWKLLQTRI